MYPSSWIDAGRASSSSPHGPEDEDLGGETEEARRREGRLVLPAGTPALSPYRPPLPGGLSNVRRSQFTYFRVSVPRCCSRPPYDRERRLAPNADIGIPVLPCRALQGPAG